MDTISGSDEDTPKFVSLRQTLANLHPNLIVSPLIPEKYKTADYAAKPTKAKEATAIIELQFNNNSLTQGCVSEYSCIIYTI